MNHFKFIMTNIPIDLDLMFTRCRWIVLLSAFFINFMIIFDKFQTDCPQCPASQNKATDPCVCGTDTPTNLEQAIRLFGIVIFAFNILNFVLWAILKLKLDLLNAFNSFENMIKEQKKQDKFRPKSAALLALPTEMIKAAEFMKEFMIQNVHKYVYILQYMAFNSYFLYLSGYAFLTILGIIVNRIFFTFLLLDIIERSLMLQNIMKSVTKNSNQLIMMGMLGFVIMFIYSMLAYYEQTLHNTMKLIDDGQPIICISPINCFVFVIGMGLRSGGGVGDPLIQPDPSKVDEFTVRIFYDISFFIIVIVIWMNVIFGIIIDTFAQLREEKNSEDADRKNVCFICSQEKTQFEKLGIFFQQHTEIEHNIWNYFFYVVHIKQKASIDYTGTESYVFDKYISDDISWFPIGKALALSNSEEIVGEDFSLQNIKELDRNIEGILKETQEQVNEAEQLLQAGVNVI